MAFGSPLPDVVIPETSVYEHVFGELSPADVEWGALVGASTGSAMTYDGLVRRIDAFARMLADRGMGVGDVVALLSPNSSAFAGTFHGILRVGATATTINVLNTASDIAKTADRLAHTTPVHRRSVARESD
jgi:acyl-coenzyme A synthetase/AMP-(fatty) acid ligase